VFPSRKESLWVSNPQECLSRCEQSVLPKAFVATEALDIRRSWSINHSDQQFEADTVMATNPALTTLPMIKSWPAILVNWYLSERVLLSHSFNVAGSLRRLFQSGLPLAVAQNHRLVIAFEFDCLLNTCSALIAEILPELFRCTSRRTAQL
jgi:hypothetical protein